MSNWPNLCDPSIPAVYKLLHAHTAITGDIEDHEQVTDLLAVKRIGFTFLIFKQSCAQCTELVDVNRFIPGISFLKTK